MDKPGDSDDEAAIDPTSSSAILQLQVHILGAFCQPVFVFMLGRTSIPISLSGRFAAVPCSGVQRATQFSKTCSLTCPYR